MSGGARKSASILIVDDDPLILKAYGQRLKGEGHTVTTAADGYEALRAAGAGTYDLILLDLRMPYRNGAEILKSLRQRRDTAETPVYLLAQPGDADLLDRALREGANGVFEKSRLGPREIGNEVQAILEGRAKPRTGPVAASAAGGGENVPSAVDEIARRFRRPTAIPPSSGNERAAAPATPAAARAAARAVSQALDDLERGTVVERRPAAERPHTEPPSPRTAYRPPDEPVADEPPYETISDDTILPEATAAARAAGASPVPAPPPTEAGFDVVLNRFMGAPAKLAQALGVPVDFNCPICKTQIVLRLWPDPTMESGVRGHFFCPKCFGG